MNAMKRFTIRASLVIEPHWSGRESRYNDNRNLNRVWNYSHIRAYTLFPTSNYKFMGFFGEQSRARASNTRYLIS